MVAHCVGNWAVKHKVHGSIPSTDRACKEGERPEPPPKCVPEWVDLPPPAIRTVESDGDTHKWQMQRKLVNFKTNPKPPLIG